MLNRVFHPYKHPNNNNHYPYLAKQILTDKSLPVGRLLRLKRISHLLFRRKRIRFWCKGNRRGLLFRLRSFLHRFSNRRNRRLLLYNSCRHFLSHSIYYGLFFNRSCRFHRGSLCYCLTCSLRHCRFCGFRRS